MKSAYIKAAVLAVTALAFYSSGICLIASMFVGQAEGMFWYGLGTLVSGVAMKIELDTFGF